MTCKILKGEEIGFDYLQKIMDIDEEVYSDLGMEGALAQKMEILSEYIK